MGFVLKPFKRLSQWGLTDFNQHAQDSQELPQPGSEQKLTP
jgi:hypothetical protein